MNEHPPEPRDQQDYATAMSGIAAAVAHPTPPAAAAGPEIIDALRSSAFFGSINRDQLGMLAERARFVDYQSDDVVFRAGDPSDSLYVVVSGQVRITRAAGSGGEVVLGIIGQGEVFGEIAVIDGGQRSAGASALGATRLAVVDGEAFMTMLHEQPAVTLRLMQTAGARQRSTIEQHNALAFAYHELEMRNSDLEARLELGRGARWRGSALLVGILFAIQVGYWGWVEHGDTISALVRSVTAQAPETPEGLGDTLDLVTVETVFIERDVGLIGKIGPGHVYDITAPFDGTVTHIGFAFGARVERGQELLRLATDELEKGRRNAEVALIEAQRALEELQNWEASSEVADLRRNLVAARESLAVSQNRLEGTRLLFNAGVVSREELDQTMSQVADAERSTAAAEESLQASMLKGSDINLYVAELKLTNAEADVKDIEAKIAQASVPSPASGVALKPLDEGGTGSTQTLALGTGATARQLLLSVGDMESLTIEAAVSELDIDAVEPGLEVEVTSEILGDQILPGVVETTASQAAPGDYDSVLAQYPVTIRLSELTPYQREKLRLGMGAEMRIIVYRNPDALVVPHEVVAGREDAWYVRRFDPATGEITDVPVTLGRSLADGIEVLTGLAAGDRVLRDPHAGGGVS